MRKRWDIQCLDLYNICSLSNYNFVIIAPALSEGGLTLPNKLSPPYPLPDLLFIAQMRLTGECFMESGSKVVVSKRVISTEIEELCVATLVSC